MDRVGLVSFKTAITKVKERKEKKEEKGKKEGEEEEHLLILHYYCLIGSVCTWRASMLFTHQLKVTAFTLPSPLLPSCVFLVHFCLFLSEYAGLGAVGRLIFPIDTCRYMSV